MLVFAKFEVRRPQGSDGTVPMKNRLRRQHRDEAEKGRVTSGCGPAGEVTLLHLQRKMFGA